MRQGNDHVYVETVDMVARRQVGVMFIGGIEAEVLQCDYSASLRTDKQIVRYTVRYPKGCYPAIPNTLNYKAFFAEVGGTPRLIQGMGFLKSYAESDNTAIIEHVGYWEPTKPTVLEDLLDSCPT